LPPVAFSILSIVGGIALGLAAWLGQRQLLKKLAEWRERELRPLRSLGFGALRFPLRPL
jgi:hypothetical protein